MPSRKLSPAVVSLIHHVELNKAGWWEQAIQRLIVSAIWLSGKPLARDEVIVALREQFSVIAGDARLRGPIDRLLSDETLVEIPAQGLQITQKAFKQFERELEEGDEVERKARFRFLSCIKDCCPALDGEQTWKEFTEQLLLPLVYEVGARTYQLVSGKSPTLAESIRFPEFLERYPKETREQLRAAVVSFMDPKDVDARSYLLRCLHSYFFVEAGNLSQETIESLMSAEKGPLNFTVFVDTNFLFSILAFHDNPSNDAAESLMKLIAELPQKVSCKLYVFPLTLDEIKHVVEFHRDNFKYVQMTPNIAAAALNAGFTGIAQKYMIASSQAGRVLSAEEYFGPYLTSLIPILRSRGIEFHNQPVDKYSTDQSVIDDIMGQLEFQKTRLDKRRKTYEEIRHDVVLWHFVRDKRPPRVESPVEAKFFVTTVDYGFLAFDGYKCKKEDLRVPVCLHPSALMQLLQFWVPRSAALDEAVVGSLRWRFLFSEFDPKTEKITLKILQTLSRFEDVGDIPTDIVKTVLLDDALRQKLLAERDVEKQVGLVREALQIQGIVSAEKLKAAEARAEMLEGKAGDQEGLISSLRETITQHNRELAQTRHDVQSERGKREAFEERVRELEENQQRALGRDLDRQKVARFMFKSLSGLGLLLAVPLLLSSSLTGGPRPRKLIDLLTVGLIFIWIWITDWRGQKIQAVNKWQPFDHFHRWKVFLFSVLIGGVLLHIVGAAAWDFIKAHIHQ